MAPVQLEEVSAMMSPQNSLLALTMLLLSAPCFAQMGPDAGLTTPYTGPTAPYSEAGPYQSPLYTEPKQEPLDKNFGLPTFGMPDAGLPQQRTTTLPAGTAAPNGLTATGQAPNAQTADRNAMGGQAGGGQTRNVPDFFKPSTDFPLPPTPPPVDGMPSTEGETPLYTTMQGMTTGVGTSSIFALPNPAGAAEAGSAPATDDTPLFTSNQGMTTDDVDSPFITK